MNQQQHPELGGQFALSSPHQTNLLNAPQGANFFEQGPVKVTSVISKNYSRFLGTSAKVNNHKAKKKIVCAACGETVIRKLTKQCGRVRCPYCYKQFWVYRPRPEVPFYLTSKLSGQ